MISVVRHFLVYTVVFNLAGYYPLTALLQQRCYDYAMEEDESSLSVIYPDNQNSGDVAWINKHEFIYKGKLYDFRYIKKQNGKTTIYAFCDENEKELKDLASQKQHSKNPFQKQFSGIDFIFIPFEKTTYSSSLTRYSMISSLSRAKHFSLNKGYCESIFSPPEII